MTQMLRLRARRFQALHALLTGEVGSPRLKQGDFPGYLLRDLGLPEATPTDRPVSQLGITIGRTTL